MPEEIFTNEQQTEIIKILKGVLLYAFKNPNISSIERSMLNEMLISCNDVISIVKEKENT